MTKQNSKLETDRSRPNRFDDDRVRLAQKGDRVASEELFAEHWPVCWRVARRMTGSDQDAEDVVQDAYVKALIHLERFDHRCAFRSWLLRIVTNCATDLIRRNRRRRILFDITGWSNGSSRPGFEPSETVDPSLALQNLELRDRLDKALAELSQTTRGAFVLYAEAGMTYQEVADTLAVPLGTVMSRIHSARKKLQTVARNLDNGHASRTEDLNSLAESDNRHDALEMSRITNPELRSIANGITG